MGPPPWLPALALPLPPDDDDPPHAAARTTVAAMVAAIARAPIWMRISFRSSPSWTALYRELPGGGGGGIVMRQTIRSAPESERAQRAAGARRGPPGSGRGVHSRLAPGGVLVALGDIALGGVGIDVRVELVGSTLERLGLLTLLL